MSVEQLTKLVVETKCCFDKTWDEVCKAKAEARELVVAGYSTSPRLGTMKLGDCKAVVAFATLMSAQVEITLGDDFHSQFQIVNGEIKSLSSGTVFVPTLDLLCGELIVLLERKGMSKDTTEWQSIPPEVLVSLPSYMNQERPWDFDVSPKGKLYTGRGTVCGQFIGKVTNTSTKSENWLFKINREHLLTLFSDFVQVPQRGNAVLPVFAQTTRKYSVKPVITNTCIKTSNGEVQATEFGGNYELIKEDSDVALLVDPWCQLSDKMNATLLD